MQNSIKDSVQEIIITLSAIHYTVKNSTATEFTFEGDLSKVQDSFKNLQMLCFSWGINNGVLSIIVHDRGEFLNLLLHIMDGESFIEETQQDAINPSHYNGTQTLDRMIAVFGIDAVISFCEINAFKYRMRAGNKDGNPIEQDIKKALWYEGKAKELKRKDNE